MRAVAQGNGETECRRLRGKNLPARRRSSECESYPLMTACVKGQNLEFSKPAGDDCKVNQSSVVIVQWNCRRWREGGDGRARWIWGRVTSAAGGAGLLPRLCRTRVSLMQRSPGMGPKLDPEIGGVPVEREIRPLAEVLELGRTTVRVKDNSGREVVKSSQDHRAKAGRAVSGDGGDRDQVERMPG